MLDQFVFYSDTGKGEVLGNFLGFEFRKYAAVEGQELIQWIEDLVGHWFALFGFLAAIGIERGISILEKRSDAITVAARKALDKSGILILLGLILLMALFTYQNFQYVLNNKEVLHWSAATSTFLPLLVGFLFYFLVILPLCFSLFYYIKLLQILTKHVEMVNEFNILHSDNMFGLRSIGRTILWNIIILAVFALPALAIQLFQKGDISFGNFSSAIVVLYFFWLVCIRPVLTLYDKLSVIKNKSYSTISSLVRIHRKNKQEVEKEERYAQVISGLRTLPLSTGELLFGAVLILALIIQIVFGALSMLNA